MAMLRNFDLSRRNTLALPCVADQLLELDSESSLTALPGHRSGSSSPLCLGGGSNLVLPPRLKRPVLSYSAASIHYRDMGKGQVMVTADAGVNWDSLVAACVDQNLRGIENLSWIPGSAGAAPVQNIGAYGVELKDVLSAVKVYDLHRHELRWLQADECCFAYRDSLFKRQPGRYLILQLSLALRHAEVSKPADFCLNYGELKSLQRLSALRVNDVREEVIRVRQQKLPDPDTLPNAGSFFKNPLVDLAHAERLKARYPDLVAYPVDAQKVKLAAGWLIDQAGWKGQRKGPVGMHEHQALVLVNYGGASQQDVLALARDVQDDIAARYELSLEIEPVVLES